MSVVAVGSFTGAPGVTALAVGLSASWPGALMVEADWQGGRLAGRFALPRDPGVVSLAASRECGDVAAHAQRLPLGVLVLVGPESGDVAHGVWSSSGPSLASGLASTGSGVVVDCGRFSAVSPVLRHVLPAASAVLVVVRNDPGDLAAAVAGAARLRREHGRVELVLVGKSPYRAGEVESALSVPVAATVPWDPAAAAAVSCGAPHRNLRASRWARSVRSLAERLAPHGAASAALGVAG